jgi:SAM-dependent methyltransferase
MIKNTCRCCDNKKLKSIISLGESPLANNLSEDKNFLDSTYPLEVMYCDKCHNCQLSYVVPPEILFKNYLYVSSTTKAFKDHFENAALKYINLFKLNSNSIVVDIGSNDGIALKPLQDRGIRVIGIEPANNIAKIANENNIETINDFFNKSCVDMIKSKYGNVDIITASNVFAHSDDIKSITKNVFNLLKEDGYFIVEIQYLLNTIKDLTFDNIYHEHVNYWSVTSLNNFFNSLGLFIVDVEHVNTHGGSIRVYVKRSSNNISSNVNTFIENEKLFGLTNYNTYQEFANKIDKIKEKVIINIKKLKDQNLKLVGYGSPAKATTSLNYFGIDHTMIDYIIEDNKLKHNKFIPCVKIPILSKEKYQESLADIIIIMAWNFEKEIKNNNKNLSGKFITIKDLEKSEFII